jgi:hypothetical protein
MASSFRRRSRSAGSQRPGEVRLPVDAQAACRCRPQYRDPSRRRADRLCQAADGTGPHLVPEGPEQEGRLQRARRRRRLRLRLRDRAAWRPGVVAWAGAATTFEPSISTSGIGGVAGALCGTTDGYEYPDYPDNPSSEARPSGSPSGTPVDPYVMGQSRTGCQATTGT